MIKSIKELENHNQAAVSTKMRLTQIAYEVEKIKEYRQTLLRSANEFNKGSIKAA